MGLQFQGDKSPSLSQQRSVAADRHGDWSWKMRAEALYLELNSRSNGDKLEMAGKNNSRDQGTHATAELM